MHQENPGLPVLHLIELFRNLVRIHGGSNSVFIRDSNVGLLEFVGEERDEAFAIFSVFVDEDELVPTEPLDDGGDGFDLRRVVLGSSDEEGALRGRNGEAGGGK